MSDFRPHVEICLFRVYTMKNMHYTLGKLQVQNWKLEVQNSCMLQEIGVEESDGDVRFESRCRNMAVLHMHN